MQWGSVPWNEHARARGSIEDFADLPHIPGKPQSVARNEG